MVDNPKVSTLADAGLLTTAEENGLDVSNISAEHPQRRRDRRRRLRRSRRRQHARPVLQPDRARAPRASTSPSVTDWASLTAALEKVVASGQEGHHVLGRRHRGGHLPVPSVVLGRRCRPDQARLERGRSRRCTLWTDWVKNGLAPNSVLQNTQGTSWDEFMTGDFGFAENGSWFKGAADDGRLHVDPGSRHRRRCRSRADRWRVHHHPGAEGHLALRHLGEDRRVPERRRRRCRRRSATSPRPQAGATRSSRPTRRLKFWVSAVGDAKPRTADNLGITYGIISEQLYTAVQNALSGAASPGRRAEATPRPRPASKLK